MPLGYFTDSTPLTPLRDPFNVLVDGINAVETAVDDLEDARAIQTFRWADATERNAQTGMQAGDVGYQVDTSVYYRYLGGSWVRNAGILASGTITAQSSFNIDGLTGFSEYEIVLDLPTASTDNTINAVLRAGGVANTSASYDSQRNTGAGSANAAAEVAGASSWANLDVAPRQDRLIRVRLNSLNDVRRTIGDVELASFGVSGQFIKSSSAIRHRSASAFDGIGFTTSGGTVTGTYTVYAR